MATTQTPPRPTSPDDEAPRVFARLLGRIVPAEVVLAAILVAVLVVLVLIEPDILEAPFENANTIVFTLGGTVLAGAAFVAMLWFRVPAAIRIPVLLVPFVAVNWWLLSPYFIDDVVDEEFSTSISAQLDSGEDQAPASAADASDPAPVDDTAADPEPAGDDTAVTGSPETGPPVTEPPTTAPAGPVLLGAGQFRGLAGHSGTGDAGIFENPDGTLVLRFENFDIQNGPDLEVYLVPGGDQVDLAEGSIHLGALKGNVGNQSYDLPAGTDLAPGSYTALVWCEAFSVEFVGATITVA